MTTRKFGLIGRKLSHSKSPELHRKIMNDMGISGTYSLIEVEPESLGEKLKELQRDGYIGVNVTIPYKEDVMKYMSSVSKEAMAIGAVNTISFEKDQMIGYNTDYHGFELVLDNHRIEVRNKRIVLLGAGGAARAVLKVLEDRNPDLIDIVSRNAKPFNHYQTITYTDFYKDEKDIDILINCTPVGMFPHVHASPVPMNRMKGSVAIDIIYNPKETLFLQYAKEAKMKTANGMDMLFGQAKKAQEIWQKR